MLRKTLAMATALVLVAPLNARPKKDDFSKRLSKDGQIRHALDRLTFGPRPGDFERVKKMGLKKWIDQQLHPDRIKENPELEARLKPLETLTMTPAEVARHYPPPQLIRAVAQGRQGLPNDPVLRATVERLAKRYRVTKEGDKNGGDIEPAVKIEQILTPDELRTLRSGTPDQRRELLRSLPEDKLDDFVVALPPPMRNQLLNFAPADMRRKLLLVGAPQQVIAYDLTEAKLSRAILGKRQLQELLADFWFNHFNVFLDKGADRYLVPSYERDAIRPHVLGKFRDLLEATASNPAMLFYLDNWQSVAPRTEMRGGRARGLNENYARELLELHTLGVDGGYTQKDIIEVARCFTGWTIRDPRGAGEFFFNDRVHDKGEKVVLGVTIPAGGGKEDGEKVLDIVARHPSTAKFVSKKLAMRFVADNPPQPLVDRMAKAFQDTGGDIRAVMKIMLESKEFWSQGAYRAKVKAPLEMIASAVRALGAEVEFAFPLANQIAQLGQPLYRKIEPTGYSSANAEWVNSAALLARMNFALALAQNRLPGVKVDGSQFSDDAVKVARQVLQRDPTPQTLRALETALKEQQAKNPKTQPTPALLAGLVIGSPDFQRR